ncbi:hypothetical protein BGW39_007618 [Mortierella sp. 14UC]|nr:hypothetical protein BGW39_007618 [Mortierella sp. 14UC]
MATFTSLPQEIIDLILPAVPKEDYFSCVFVNRGWCAVFAPCFWRDVRMVAESGNSQLISIEARKALVRNGHHVRVLETTDPSVVFTLATSQPPITSLEALTIRLQDPVAPIAKTVHSDNVFIPVAQSTGKEKELDDFRRCSSSVLEILRNNPGLRFLSLDEGYFRYKDGKEGFLDLSQTFPTAHLEKLELSFRRDPSSHAYSLDHDDYQGEIFDAAKEAHSRPVQTPFLALTEIAITTEKTLPMDPRRLMFFLRCPNLERIRLARLDDMTMKAIAILLSTSCPKVTCLEWTNPHYDVEDNIVQLIQSTLLGWKELRLPDMPEFGPDGFHALMTHRNTLEVLKVESAERLDHNAAVDLLCAAQKLRRLEGPADGQRTKFTQELTVFAYDTYLDHVQGMADRRWVLGPSMEFLQLRIEGVPRPDVLYRQSGGELAFLLPALDPALRFVVQGWIYLQLNRMVNLQELILGETDFSQRRLDHLNVDASLDSIALEEALLDHEVRAFNYQSMEFSLESGLMLLGGLKELRVLDVRRTAHRIGIAELEWMYTNWPKLKEIRGLVTERRWADRAEDGARVKEEVEAWIAAHPKGIGSSFT